ncbi:MAG: hypothetical protein AAF456_02520 [Planctomycetota bacterium]
MLIYALADSLLSARNAAVAITFAALLCFGASASADVYEFFDNVNGTPDGEFTWDDFGLTGSPYEGPHAPDQGASGVGNGVVTVTSGGLITTTNNLYSLFSIARWSVGINSLEESDQYTSVVVQFAVSSTFVPGDFTLDGNAPDEFIDLGQRASAGGFPYNFYWVEWQGVPAGSDYEIALQGTGQHQSIAGAKATYFNTATPYDITSSNLTTVIADSATVTRGVYDSGSTAELAGSDDMDYVVRRSNSDIQSRTEFEIAATSPSMMPTSIEFTYEGAVFARGTVTQTIELYDYDAQQWVQIDSRNASRFTDSVITVDATGDLSRFVEPGTFMMEARVRHVSANPRQVFTTNTDQCIWTIGE